MSKTYRISVEATRTVTAEVEVEVEDSAGRDDEKVEDDARDMVYELADYKFDWNDGEVDMGNLDIIETELIEDTDPVNPVVSLDGIQDDALAILARCKQKLQDVGEDEKIPDFLDEATSGNFGHLLSVVEQYFDVSY